ncbi:MAG: SRPBCC domain-containing protein [Leptolyngbya sp.]|nr:SRPBCC domain-containing protein [Candidatus Melainabacteria bacterium]
MKSNVGDSKVDSEVGTEAGSFTITRVVAAPRDVVFKAFTDESKLAQWWGPKGLKMGVTAFNLNPEGDFHYSMTAPEGHEMWGKWVFRDILPSEKLVFVSSFSDAAGGITRHPAAEEWPLETLSTITFTELESGSTSITLVGGPIDATPSEQKVFEAGLDSMRQGFNGTFDQLDAFLAKEIIKEAK